MFVLVHGDLKRWQCEAALLHETREITNAVSADMQDRTNRLEQRRHTLLISTVLFRSHAEIEGTTAWDTVLIFRRHCQGGDKTPDESNGIRRLP